MNSYISYPTLFLFLSCMIIWWMSLIISEYNYISDLLGILICSLSSFGLFIVMHDASHSSLSRNKWINEIIGRIAAIQIYPFSSYIGFKIIHKIHHKYTNHPSKDPDYWVSHENNKLLIILKSTTLVFYYYYYYISNCLNKNNILETIELFTQQIIFLYFYIYTYINHYDIFIIISKYWVIGGLFTYILIVFFIDYLPHRVFNNKITTTPDVNKYNTTSLLKTNIIPQKIITFLLLYQDYHIIHHLYPNIPFYKYEEIWLLKKNYLLEKNILIQELF